MIAKKKEFFVGVGLMIGFLVVLVLFFLPLYGGENGLDYLDKLYNSISKGSAYYIPKMKEESERFKGTAVRVNMKMQDGRQAEETASLFRAGGAQVEVSISELGISGDLGMILDNALADADAMYINDGPKLQEKYGYDGRKVLYNWWSAFKEMDKHLKKDRKFKEGDVVSLVQKKALETSYNYYGVDPQKISERLGTVFFSLLFYVVYTLWYGFSILYMFEGWGLILAH